MPRTRVKICGITRPEDARAAAEAGADAIGIVFDERAGRYVSPGRAREILAVLPAFVTPVGLFVDASVDHVRRVAGGLGVRHIQLHGHESAEVVRAPGEFRVLKAVKVPQGCDGELKGWKESAPQNLVGLVLESAGPGVGGTGVENDWAAIAAQSFSTPVPPTPGPADSSTKPTRFCGADSFQPFNSPSQPWGTFTAFSTRNSPGALTTSALSWPCNWMCRTPSPPATRRT